MVRCSMPKEYQPQNPNTQQKMKHEEHPLHQLFFFVGNTNLSLEIMGDSETSKSMREKIDEKLELLALFDGGMTIGVDCGQIKAEGDCSDELRLCGQTPPTLWAVKSFLSGMPCSFDAFIKRNRDIPIEKGVEELQQRTLYLLKAMIQQGADPTARDDAGNDLCKEICKSPSANAQLLEYALEVCPDRVNTPNFWGATLNDLLSDSLTPSAYHMKDAYKALLETPCGLAKNIDAMRAAIEAHQIKTMMVKPTQVSQAPKKQTP